MCYITFDIKLPQMGKNSNTFGYSLAYLYLCTIKDK